MRKGFILILILVSLAAFMALKIKTDQIRREDMPGSSIIYIPSGKALKYATFGNSSLMADLIYLWAIQYYSDYTVPERYEYLDHVFSVIAELDHRYLDPYQIGALIAIYEAGDFEAAYKILDRGLEKNPDQWIFPFQAAHYAQMMAKDYRRAQEYYQKTMSIEGSPAIAKRLYANAAYELADYETAWATWKDVYENAEDERIRKIASNHLYRVKAAMDLKALREAVEKYKNTYGRNPADLSQLVRSGFMPSLPQDLDGKDYLYDPQTGKVKVPTIPWKR